MTVEKIKKIWLASGMWLVRDIGGYWIEYRPDDANPHHRVFIYQLNSTTPGKDIVREVCDGLFVKADMEARERARQQPLFGENLED